MQGRRLWSRCRVGNNWIVNPTPIPECLWQRPCGVALDAIPEPVIVELCGVVGRATAFIGGAVVSIPKGSALKLRQWTFGSSTAWLVSSKSAGQPPFL